MQGAYSFGDILNIYRVLCLPLVLKMEAADWNRCPAERARA